MLCTAVFVLSLALRVYSGPIESRDFHFHTSETVSPFSSSVRALVRRSAPVSHYPAAEFLLPLRCRSFPFRRKRLGRSGNLEILKSINSDACLQFQGEMPCFEEHAENATASLENPDLDQSANATGEGYAL